MTSRLSELQEWLARVSGPDWTWYAKYLSANDTYAKPNVHQGGPYVGKGLLQLAFPDLSARADLDPNPDVTISVSLASSALSQDVRLVWYNSRRLEGRANGRDEARITKWGGRDHPLLTAEATGSLVLFSFFRPNAARDAVACEIWIADDADEEGEILGLTGPVDPGAGIIFRPSIGLVSPGGESVGPCGFDDREFRDEWHTAFPSGDDILEMAMQRLPDSRQLDPDRRLLRRRECEFSLFLAIENRVILPRVREGFTSVEEFVGLANAVTNRRKSRSGKSLELHARVILKEESVEHSWGARTEGHRTPDFLFPSIDRYNDPMWPADRLRMLAAKTTCKDRWRQILNEASRVRVKHLLTLQEGVSEAQYQEMKDEGVRLVVPRSLHSKFPISVRPELLSLAQFIDEAQLKD